MIHHLSTVILESDAQEFYARVWAWKGAHRTRQCTSANPSGAAPRVISVGSHSEKVRRCGDATLRDPWFFTFLAPHDVTLVAAGHFGDERNNPRVKPVAFPLAPGAVNAGAARTSLNLIFRET